MMFTTCMLILQSKCEEYLFVIVPHFLEYLEVALSIVKFTSNA